MKFNHYSAHAGPADTNKFIEIDCPPEVGYETGGIKAAKEVHSQEIDFASRFPSRHLETRYCGEIDFASRFPPRQLEARYFRRDRIDVQ